MPTPAHPAGPAAPNALRDYLYAKGDLRPLEVVTCVVVWLADARGLPSVSAHDIRAHYRPHDRPPDAAPLRCVSDALRRAHGVGLLAEVAAEVAAEVTADVDTAPDARPEASHGPPLTRGIVARRRPDAGPRFVPTALGRRVADTLPDKREVGTLRGLPGAAALHRSAERLLR